MLILFYGCIHHVTINYCMNTTRQTHSNLDHKIHHPHVTKEGGGGGYRSVGTASIKLYLGTRLGCMESCMQVI